MASNRADSDLNETLGPEITGVIVSTWGISLLALILRFIARRISEVGYWIDDWLALAAFVRIATYVCHRLY